MAGKIKRKWIFFIVIILLVVIGVLVFYLLNFYKQPSRVIDSHESKPVIITNPMNEIVSANIDKSGNIDLSKVVSEGEVKFNESFIAFIVNSMGVSKLHKSTIGYGNPRIEFSLDSEIWSMEVSGGLNIGKGEIEDPDLKIIMTKEEAVKSLLSNDIKEFMKDSVTSGRTEIEMIAGEVELFSKGYLDMYKELTGEYPKI
jgi:hypothetical protein